MFNEKETKFKGKISKWFLLIGGTIILIGIITGWVYLKGKEEIERSTLPLIGQEEVVVGNAKWKVIEVKDKGNVLSGSENLRCKVRINQIKAYCCQGTNFKAEDFLKRSIKELKTACKRKYRNLVTREECINVIKNVRERDYCKDKITSGKFIEIIMAVENLGDTRGGVDRVVLVDAKGNEFEVISNLQNWVPRGRGFVAYCNPALFPGESDEVSGIYEIPKNIKNLKVKVPEFLPPSKCGTFFPLTD